MAVSKELKEKVLADYRSKAVTSAAGLAKKHGLSRSSVYRILSAVAPATTGKASAVPGSGPQLVVSEKDDDEESVASQVSRSYLMRSDRFADDLGLTSTKLTNVPDESPVDAEEREQQIESAMEVILGERGETYRTPAFLDTPPPRQLPVHHEAPREVPTGLIDRDDVTQRIIFIVEHFGPIVAGVIGSDAPAFLQQLATKSDVELVRLLRTLERTRSVGNIAAGFKQVFYFAGQTTEMLTKIVGLKTDGFASHLREQDRELTMIMKEIALNQWERVKDLDSPEMRLGSMFCLTLLQTDAVNRMKALRSAPQTPVNPSVVEATADL